MVEVVCGVRSVHNRAAYLSAIANGREQFNSNYFRNKECVFVKRPVCVVCSSAPLPIWETCSYTKRGVRYSDCEVVGKFGWKNV